MTTPRKLPDNVQLERELGQLIDQVWDEASGRASPEEHVRMRGAAYGFAASLFVAGRVAARPSVDLLERIIKQARETSQGSADENRIIAEAVIDLIKNYDLRVYKGPSEPAAPGEDSCTITAIRAIDELDEGHAEVEITVRCTRSSLWKDRPGEHPWFGEFRHRMRLAWNQGQMGSNPDGWIRFEVPRDQLDDFIRAVRRVTRHADAEYQALLARRRERVEHDAQAQREKQADPARQARLAEDQARIDQILAQTEQ